MEYPKRLIEVDLPIARISAHARREKSIRHGHISTLHIWWARRPLAACRAVICASLWPDPADDLCPQRFRNDAARIMAELRGQVLHGKLSDDQHAAREPVERIHVPESDADYPGLRRALLDFIAEFANWDLSTNRFFLDASRALTQSAHESLGGAAGTRPLVVDPFAGGGSIPLEALRVGADAFASDLNPIPVLLNKVVLEYIPKYGKQLADEVRKWGQWIKERAEEELAEFYPPQKLPVETYHPQPKAKITRCATGETWHLDGIKKETPIAYLWARTILSEAPGEDGVPVEVPLKGAAKAVAEGDTQVDTDQDEETDGKKSKPTAGFGLEFDAARKIAQGLGAHLDKLPTVIEIKGDKARLLSVAERTRHLFGKDAEADKPRGRRKKKSPQMHLFEELEAVEQMAESGGWALGGTPMGQTTLDRIHQAMILFAAARGEALKRFLVEDGAGKDARFWKLAQSLSALYPTGTDEKRWVDGVLGRKKGLGL